MKSSNNAGGDNMDVVRPKDANPLARLDAAMEKFIKVTEDFMIRTSYHTDRQASKEIASLKAKRQALLVAIQLQRQKMLEIQKGYAFLATQLDEVIKDMDLLLEGNNG